MVLVIGAVYYLSMNELLNVWNNNIIIKMGNKQCPDCKHDPLQSIAYGHFQIQQQNQQYFAVVQKKVQKNDQLKSHVIRQLQMRQNIGCMHVTKLYRFMLADQEYGFKTTMFYEYLPKSLRDRIGDVRDERKIFLEREIVALISGIETALDTFAKFKIKHCCINLDTILLKNNTYKLSDVSATTYLTSYDLVTQGKGQQFLSERLLQRLESQSLHPIYTYEDDLFSLGMVALVVGTLYEPDSFYKWQDGKHGKLNRKLIAQCLKIIQKRYSSKLTSKIKQLLSQNIEQTLSSIQNQPNQQGSKLRYNKNYTLNSTTITPQKSLTSVRM